MLAVAKTGVYTRSKYNNLQLSQFVDLTKVRLFDHGAFVNDARTNDKRSIVRAYNNKRGTAWISKNVGYTEQRVLEFLKTLEGYPGKVKYTPVNYRKKPKNVKRSYYVATITNKRLLSTIERECRQGKFQQRFGGNSSKENRRVETRP